MMRDFKEIYENSSYNVDGKIVEVVKEHADISTNNGYRIVNNKKTIYTVCIDDEKIFTYFGNNREFSDIELVEGVLGYATSDEVSALLDSVDRLMKLTFESQSLSDEQKENYFKTYTSVNNDYNYIIAVLKNKNVLEKAVALMKKQAEQDAQRKAKALGE